MGEVCENLSSAFAILPEELRFLILNFTPLQDALTFCLVCKTWKNYIHHNDQIWFNYAVAMNPNNKTKFQPFRNRLEWRRYFMLDYYCQKRLNYSNLPTTTSKQTAIEDDGVSFTASLSVKGSKPPLVHRPSVSKVSIRNKHTGEDEEAFVIIGNYMDERQLVPLVHLYTFKKYAFEAIEDITGDIPPSNFWRHTAVVIGRLVYIFGGSHSSKSMKVNNAYEFNLDQKRFKLLSVTGDVPCERSDHAATAVDDRMYVFGGSNKHVEPMNDMHYLDTKTNVWHKVKYNGVPPKPRSAHSICHNNGHIFVYGGGQWMKTHWGCKFSDLHMFNLETSTWITVNCSNGPEAGTFPGLIQFDHYLLQYAGGVEMTVSGDMYLYNIVTQEWKKIEKSSNIITLDGPSLVFRDTESEMYVYGGFRGRVTSTFSRLKLRWRTEALSVYNKFFSSQQQQV